MKMTLDEAKRLMLRHRDCPSLRTILTALDESEARADENWQGVLTASNNCRLAVEEADLMRPVFDLLRSYICRVEYICDEGSGDAVTEWDALRFGYQKATRCPTCKGTGSESGRRSR